MPHEIGHSWRAVGHAPVTLLEGPPNREGPPWRGSSTTLWGQSGHSLAKLSYWECPDTRADPVAVSTSTGLSGRVETDFFSGGDGTSEFQGTFYLRGSEPTSCASSWPQGWEELGERTLSEPAGWVPIGTPSLVSALQSPVGHLVCRVPPAVLVCLPANPKDTVGHKWSFQSGIYGGGMGWQGSSVLTTLRTLWSPLGPVPGCLAVSGWLGGYHLPGRDLHWHLLPEVQPLGHSALQRRHGHPQPDPQADLLLLRLPHVPGAWGWAPGPRWWGHHLQPAPQFPSHQPRCWHCCLLSFPRSLPCPPPSPCPREPTLPPETGIQGAGWGLVWALGTRMKGVQVSGLLEEPRGPLAIPAWL